MPSATSLPTQTPLPPATRPLSPPTPTPFALRPAVVLLSPADGQEFGGADSEIRLSWEPGSGLQESEWYAVSVRYQDGGATHYAGTWQKETSWRLPGDLYRKADPLRPGYEWDVVVMKQTGAKADGGREGVPVSDVSTPRTLYWR